MSVTAQDNYWQIVSWYEMPYGRVPKGMWLGHAKNPLDRIWWENPEPPQDVKEILNWDKPRADQFWLRHESPKFWEKDYLVEMAIDKFSTGKTRKEREKNADYYWYKNVDWLTDEQFEYQDREWDRRLRGIWIFIDGVATYLTGKYYTFLQHWWLVDCYPEFIDRDLITFYFWQHVCNDSMCYGAIFPKHRRGGHTSKWAFEGTEETTRTKGGHFGIQAAGEKGAGKVFKDKVIPGWKRWPYFFKPEDSSGDNPKTEIIMDAESRRGRSQHKSRSSEALEGWIKFAPNGDPGVEPFDGDKLRRFFRDEGGKEKKGDILDTWDLVKPTLTGRMGRGKSAWPSTVEDVGGKYAGAFEKLYLQSLPSLALSTGTRETVSGLKALFLPCYCGHEEFWFIGKFGESIVNKPTPEQREWLLANRALEDGVFSLAKQKELEIIYDQGGAYEYELRRRAANGQNIKHKRKFPFEIEEVFAPTNPLCFYNLDKLTDCLQGLKQPTANDSNVIRELTVRGRLEWVDKKFLGPQGVYFVEDTRGPFLFNKAYLPGGERAKKLGIVGNSVNRSERDGKVMVTNKTGSVIKIGFDPQKQDSDESTSHKSNLSKAAGHGFYPYDPGFETDAWDEPNPKFSQNYITHACLFEYHLLPLVSNATHEDMLKACVFFNAKFHSEKQVFEAIKYFKQVGAGGLIFRDAGLNGMNRQSGLVVAGQAANPLTEIMANNRIRDFVEHHCYPDRFPFEATISQLIKYNGRNATQLDLKVSFGFTLMAVQPDAEMDFKLRPAPEHTAPEKPNLDKWTNQYATLTPGLTL